MPEPVDHPSADSQDFIDDLDIDFSDLQAKYTANADSGFESFIVIDGAPKVPEAKVGLLTTFLKKEFGKIGAIAENGFYMPLQDGKTQGFVFIEYESKESADKAIQAWNRRKLDKNHTLLVNKLSDVDRYGVEGRVSTTYEPPVIEDFEQRQHLYSWMADPQGRDQVVLHKGDNVGVYWFQKANSPETAVSRDNWTEKYVRWSPKGTYLVSLHRQGVQLWGGAKWERFGRFAHRDVAMIEFSPNEQYVVTCSEVPITLPPIDSPERAHCPFKEQDSGNHVVVWDVKTELPLRSFPMRRDSDNPSKKPMWPFFKWSANSKYFARIVENEGISVYEAPSMGLLDKKSIKIPGIADFEWAPATVNLEGKKNEDESQVLCYWTPEMPNQTARVSIMSLPSRNVVRSRNLFNVSGCRLHWQSQARFLCVKVDRHTKTKKSTYTNLEFFRLEERDIPVEVVELKETVVNFSWEPRTDRFVIISFLDSGAAATPGAGAAAAGLGSGAPINRNIVSFYDLDKAAAASTGKWKLLKKLEKKNWNSLYWSPKGRFVIVATVRPSSACELEFFDMDHEVEQGKGTSVHAVGAAEHFGMTSLEWDPSGRFVASWSSYWRHALDNGYKIWDFRGESVREEAIDKFKAFSWRPRPASLLSKNQKKDITKNLKKYSRRFMEEDEMEASEASRQLILQRREALKSWKEWRQAVEAKLKAEGYMPESELAHATGEGEVIEETREEILEEKEEIVTK